MRKIFDPCINRTLELIDGQVSSVMKAKLGKPKMVLVVGGFGRNEYLYGKVVDYCRQRGIETRQPLAP
jgi:tRNA A37 threonylcarbamoyltransferase TsaD